MFAKVFGQIFDSSIAEDYNCRRMFIDLLVLADWTGAVDMTYEAIARRTNVPIEEVRKYIAELSQPDSTSRSKFEDGRRIMLLDSHRDWGWQIVNYEHYRDIKDKETLRGYFRDKKRSQRKALKLKEKQMSKTTLDSNGQSLTPVSVSYSSLKEGVRGRFEQWMKFRRGLGKKPKDWDAMFEKQAEWLSKFEEKTQSEILDQSIRNGWQGLFEPKTVGSIKPEVKDEKQSKLAQKLKDNEQWLEEYKQKRGVK